MIARCIFASALVSVMLLLGLAGCGDAVSSGHTTALDGQDLNTMTDQMAAGIAGDADVQSAIAEKGTIKVVVQPVNNLMTGEVLPSGQAQTFTGRVRLLLSQHNREQYTWVINRDYYNYLRGTELDGVRGPDPDRVQPDYYLTATFSTLTHDNGDRRSVYFLCAYELSNIKTGTVLWTGKYEVKKATSKGFLD